MKHTTPRRLQPPKHKSRETPRSRSSLQNISKILRTLEGHCNAFNKSTHLKLDIPSLAAFISRSVTIRCRSSRGKAVGVGGQPHCAGCQIQIASAFCSASWSPWSHVNTISSNLWSKYLTKQVTSFAFEWSGHALQ